MSAGSAFRNPTLTENHLMFTQLQPTPEILPDSLFDALDLNIVGNKTLGPERILFIELAHRARFGPKLKVESTAFHYRLRDPISATVTGLTFDPPTARVTTSFANDVDIHASGGEFGLYYLVTRDLAVAVSYGAPCRRWRSRRPHGQKHGADAQAEHQRHS